MDLTIKGFQERISNPEYMDYILKPFKAKNEIKKFIKEYNILNNEVFEMLKVPIDSRTKDIHRQVFIKIASEQVKEGSPEELIKYASELEKAYDGWQ